MGINYYKGRVCLNVLGGSLKNAEEIYEAAEKYVLVGVLSANYPDVPSAVEDMEKYMNVLEGNLSVGLGGGNPAQWKAVGDIAKEIKANHFNQVFSAVGYTRANVGNDEAHINALVSMRQAGLCKDFHRPSFQGLRRARNCAGRHSHCHD